MSDPPLRISILSIIRFHQWPEQGNGPLALHFSSTISIHQVGPIGDHRLEVMAAFFRMIFKSRYTAARSECTFEDGFSLMSLYAAYNS
jgi:hypothetical protein